MKQPELKRFSPATERALRGIGWYPGRTCAFVELRQWFVVPWQSEAGYCCIFPKALTFLREFGGLRFDNAGPGVSHATTAFLLNPFSALGNEDDRWLYYEWLLDENLFPVGVTIEQDEVIAISRSGKFCLLGTSDCIFAQTIEGAMRFLLEGVGDSSRFWNAPYDENLVANVDMLKKLIRQAHDGG